jgi:hypothetical protein
VTDAEKAARAKAQYDRQCHYDRLHHMMRIRDFEASGKLDHFDFGLLQQSRRCLESPAYAYRSVDLEDSKYLAELDAFASMKRDAA